jgi:2-dehydro-3-deoxygalactonokinase
LHNAFGVRALALFGRLSAAESASYLSGLLIGEELGRQTLPAEVIVIGASALVARYAFALGARGTKVRTFGAEATWAGLRDIVRGKR